MSMGSINKQSQYMVITQAHSTVLNRAYWDSPCLSRSICHHQSGQRPHFIILLTPVQKMADIQYLHAHYNNTTDNCISMFRLFVLGC